MSEPTTERQISPPRTWLILGERTGDNAQVLALGRALGWPGTVKQIHHDDSCTVDFKDRGASLTGIDLPRSDPLTAPWPDAIIAIGRRSVPVARSRVTISHSPRWSEFPATVCCPPKRNTRCGSPVRPASCRSISNERRSGRPPGPRPRSAA